jgi:hypothetical protein
MPPPRRRPSEREEGSFSVAESLVLVALRSAEAALVASVRQGLEPQSDQLEHELQLVRQAVLRGAISHERVPFRCSDGGCRRTADDRM